MATYNTDGSYEVNFEDYKYNNVPGSFIYRLRRKQMNHTGNMTLFLDGQNGVKHRGMVYPDRKFLGMKDINPGAKLKVDYVQSSTGSIYIRTIQVVCAV